MKAWAEITKALAASPDPADRKLSKSIVDFVMETEVAQGAQRMRAAQRQTELAGHDNPCAPAFPLCAETRRLRRILQLPD